MTRIACLWMMALSTTAPAETIEVRPLSQPTPLDGVWKQIVGDDPKYSEPGFDDSGWSDARMTETNPRFVRGTSWYRIKARLPQSLPEEPIGILIGPLCYAYDIYLNGQLSGTFGDPRRGGWGQAPLEAEVFSASGNSRALTIAIRCVNRVQTVIAADSLGERRSWIGSLTQMKTQLELERARRRGRIPFVMTLTVLVTLAILFLITPLWRSDAPEFFWCGVTLILIALNRAIMGFPEYVGSIQIRSVISSSVAGGYLLSMRAMFSILFERDLRLPIRVLFYSTVGASFLLSSLYLLNFETFILYAGPLGMAIALTMAIVYWDLARFGTNIREAPIMHVGIGLYLSTLFLYYGSVLARRAGITDMGPLPGILRYSQEIATVGLMAFPIAMVILLNRRSGRVLLDRQRLQQEIDTAAEMQALLVPALAVKVPGFDLETEYLPASEVGGDFYWTRREPDGSLLIVVGDVSGKGLRAAMLVSVAIGVLRNEPSRSPALMLRRLNDAFIGNTGGGFITCLAARLDPDGLITIANAGHVTPYCEGSEASLESGLPLGVVAGTEYGESTLTGNYLVFVSDGVIEASNEDRELFGFARAREVSTQSAKAIAEAARVWGQNDDITVVTVRRIS